MGGKKRIGKEVAAVILEVAMRVGFETDTYVEPFLGMGGVMKHMNGFFAKRVGNDLNGDVIVLWQGLQNGWKPARQISRQRWQQLRDSNKSSPERSFAGIACSFGGALFQGYVENTKTRDWVGEAARSFEAFRPYGDDVKVSNVSYDQLKPRDAIVYCDPPYASTRGFNGMAPFDSDHFWRVMDDWTLKRNCLVFVSEETAPDDWVPVWSSSVDRSFGLMKRGEHQKGKDYKHATEQLFVHSKWLQDLDGNDGVGSFEEVDDSEDE